MANYKDIKGFHVQSLSSDPVAAQFVGGSWASGGDLNVAKGNTTGCGIQTAALCIAGQTAPGAKVATTESYNGSSFTEVGDLTTARSLLAGAGTSTASIAAGGDTTTAVANAETYNGTAWTETGDLNTARKQLAGSSKGSTTATIVFGGSPPANLANTESWNGTSWTEVNDLNTGRSSLAGTGTKTAALAALGASSPGNLANTESWNGTSWTEVNNANQAREYGSSNGTQTSALVYGFQPSPLLALTEAWDGTNWTEVSDLGTGRYAGAGAGAGNDSGLQMGGYTTAFVATTEEWTAPSTFSKTNLGQVYFNSSSTNAFKVTEQPVPGGTWSSGGNMNNERAAGAGAGTSLTAALSFGGSVPPYSADTELYNGTAWTELNNLN